MLRQHFLELKTTNLKNTEKSERTNAPLVLGCVFFSCPCGWFSTYGKELKIHPIFLQLNTVYYGN